MRHPCVIHSSTGRVSFDLSLTSPIPHRTLHACWPLFVLVLSFCPKNGSKEPEKEEADAWTETKRGASEKGKREVYQALCFLQAASIWTHTCVAETLPADKQRPDGTRLTAALVHSGRSSVGKWTLGGGQGWSTQGEDRFSDRLAFSYTRSNTRYWIQMSMRLYLLK